MTTHDGIARFFVVEPIDNRRLANSKWLDNNSFKGELLLRVREKAKKSRSLAFLLSENVIWKYDFRLFNVFTNEIWFKL